MELAVHDVKCFYLQNAQKGVGVAILTSTDGIKVVSPDGKVVDWLLATVLFILGSCFKKCQGILERFILISFFLIWKGRLLNMIIAHPKTENPSYQFEHIFPTGHTCWTDLYTFDLTLYLPDGLNM